MDNVMVNVLDIDSNNFGILKWISFKFKKQ